MKSSILSLAIACSISYSAFAAQNNLTGIILDKDGEIVVGADVHLKSVNRKTTTDSEGRFTFNDLKEGRYVLDIKAGSLGHVNHAIINDGNNKTIRLDYHDIETIVVTASPLEHSRLGMAAPTVVISGDELVKNRGSNIGETLSQTPGVNLSSFGSGAGRPVIRGQQGNRVTVLSNNSSTQDASNASPDHWIAAEPLLAQRIEVLKGPATLLYGGGAIGGAVNVVDNKIASELPDGIDGGFEVRLGDSATGEISTVATLSTAHENMVFHIDAYKSTTDAIEIASFAESARMRASEGEAEPDEGFGILENTDTDTNGGSLGFSYVTDAGHWGLSYTKHSRNYGLPGEHGHEEVILPMPPVAEEEEIIRLDLDQSRLDLEGVWENPFEYFDSLKVLFANTDYEHQELEGPEIGTTFTNKADELRIELVHQAWNGWQGAFGLQYSDSDFAAIGDEAFIPASNSNKLGLFWLEERDFDSLHTELGIRFDRQEIKSSNLLSKTFNAFSFAAGTVWHIDDKWSLPINFANAKRLPASEELLSNAGNSPATYVPHLATLTVEVGDINLSEETSNNIDIGLRYHSDKFHASIAIFNNRVDNFIYLRDTGAEIEELPVLQYSQRDATFEGAEVEVSWDFISNQDVFWKLGLFADYTHAEFSGGDGAYIPRTPAKRFGANLGYSYNDLSIDMKFIDVAKQNKIASQELQTDGYQDLSINLGYNIDFNDSELLLFLRAQNILDEEIRDHSSFIKDIAPRAGRSISTGFRVTF